MTTEESSSETEERNRTADSTTETERESKIHLENLQKVFGRITALEDVSLTIAENEIFALVGDNGAGKSTLMNILSGVYGPTEGQVFYDGESVDFSNPSEARKRGIETVYQDLGLMDDLDVATNIFMGSFPVRGIGPLKIVDWGETYSRADQIIHEQLDRDLGLETEVNFFSGGERQLIAIARALAFDPEVIMLDEPTSALSVDATNLVHDTIRHLREEGHTIVIISHNIEDVLGLADRIGVLHRGKLVEITSAEDTSLESLTNLMTTGSHS